MNNIIEKEKKSNIVQTSLREDDKSFNNISISIQPDTDIELIVPALDQISLIEVDFGSFDDGRGYSQVKLLRKKFNYSGEIRALNVHIDHLQFILRSGIDSYELLPEDKKYDANYANDFSVCYQSAENNTGLIEKHKYICELGSKYSGGG